MELTERQKANVKRQKAKVNPKAGRLSPQRTPPAQRRSKRERQKANVKGQKAKVESKERRQNSSPRSTRRAWKEKTGVYSPGLRANAIIDEASSAQIGQSLVALFRGLRALRGEPLFSHRG
jgi:hypothetical protein